MPIFTHHHHHHHLAPPQFLSHTHKKFLLFFLKCIVMLAVISIFLFFLGFAAAVLLHFLFTSNTFHRSAAADTAGEPETLPIIEALLPEVLYSATDCTLDCAICLDIFREGDKCRRLLGCKHLFHVKCVDRWIKKRPTCPVCRTRVDLDPARLPGLGMDGDDQWKRIWGVDFDEGTSY